MILRSPFGTAFRDRENRSLEDDKCEQRNKPDGRRGFHSPARVAYPPGSLGSDAELALESDDFNFALSDHGSLVHSAYHGRVEDIVVPFVLKPIG